MDSNLQRIFDRYSLVLTEGSKYERLRRDPHARLDPDIAHAGMIYEEDSRHALSTVYREYLDIGKRYDLPIITFTPTWKANEERIFRSRHRGKNVNADATEFLSEIINSYSSYKSSVLLGALLGCRGDSYCPGESLSSEDSYKFHAYQVEKLSETNVDFLLASTLPALSEAVGIARLMSESTKPYFVSFVIRPNGTLLDGNLLGEAITEIDLKTKNPPFGYFINCVHPETFLSGIEINRKNYPAIMERVFGLRANTSKKSPEELNTILELDTEEPASFVCSLLSIHSELGARVLGGCCGTDAKHIEALAKNVDIEEDQFLRKVEEL